MRPLEAPSTARGGCCSRQATILTLDDVMTRFGALTDTAAPPDHAHVRGTVLAVGMDWLLRIPAGPARDAALERLLESAELACAALNTAD
ncbi:hypothetical protein [Actinomadura sp. CNU-125]|uniref:hypothetical protein n=1 Tax=Actinomadura sp. CNU-125 TaxID=1904961 RepID=UPI001177BCE4|nr:hypothetical protein [Actinomadura sp. CNU-125]